MVRARSGVPLKRGRKRTRKLTKGFRQSRHNLYRSEEHTSELQSHSNLVCRLLLEKKKYPRKYSTITHETQPLAFSKTSSLSTFAFPTLSLTLPSVASKRRHTMPLTTDVSSTNPTR